ncbi:MAG: imidazole glycerol phosphate synthase subunit HisH [Candidatus Omnitrophica bacterium]|nr:imidazole glycerol phosphate synthase subunit HisH [Candidatus Omnitrophota bacterium]
MIAIIDYGMGNIHSVNKAFQLYGAETIVTNNAEEIRRSKKIVLPGVGAFDEAMQELKKRSLISVIREELVKGKPFLGICLGMQLLFEHSAEAGQAQGLGILKGRVEQFEDKADLKVPHMGWNRLQINKKDCPLLKDLSDSPYVYFCHSYYPIPVDNDVIAATTNYGKDFVSVVWQNNVYGVQFHPEKSQRVGLRIIENFLALC